MEDILASIRRILNEEEAPTAARDEARVDDDVLVLDESMMVSATEPEPEPEPPAARAEPPAAEPEPTHHAIKALTSPNQTDPQEAPTPLSELIAPETAAAAASSVDSLVRTLTAGRNMRVYSGGPTLEDMVRAELRPLLKDWLDANLPPIVERLVRTEIERVVGRSVP
jgi:uncharacterized protein